MADGGDLARSSLPDSRKSEFLASDLRIETLATPSDATQPDTALDLWMEESKSPDVTDLVIDLPAEPDLTDLLSEEQYEPDLSDSLSDEVSKVDLYDATTAEVSEPELMDSLEDELGGPDLADMMVDELGGPEIVDLLPEEIPEPPCEIIPIPSCPIHFSIETTYPVAQAYVWLTGSFNGWATSLEDGAVPLTLNDSGTLWQADVVLDNDLLQDYKFLMGWTDNPDPSWVTQDWDFAGGAPNSKVHVLCGETGCGIPTFVHRPRLQWPDETGFWILAETDINVPLEYIVTWDSGSVVVTSTPERVQIFWLGPPGEHPPGYQHRTFIPLPTIVDQVEVQITNGPEWQETMKRPHLAEALRLAVYGDTRSQSEPHQMVVDAVVAEKPDAVLVTGDMIDIAVHWNEWEEWSKIEETILESSFWLPVYGNHDTIEGGLGRPYLEHWFQTDNRYRSGGSYWLDLGIVGLVVLDTYGTDFTQDEGLNWLAYSLAVLQDKEWLFVAFHEPYYGYMGHPPWLPGLDFIDPVLQAHDVDIVFNGHNHAYEHYLVGETHFMVTGGGGAPLSDFVGPPPPELEQFLVASGAFHHYVLLDITADSLTAKVVQLPEDVVVDELVLVK